MGEELPPEEVVCMEEVESTVTLSEMMEDEVEEWEAKTLDEFWDETLATSEETALDSGVTIKMGEAARLEPSDPAALMKASSDPSSGSSVKSTTDTQLDDNSEHNPRDGKQDKLGQTQ